MRNSAVSDAYRRRCVCWEFYHLRNHGLMFESLRTWIIKVQRAYAESRKHKSAREQSWTVFIAVCRSVVRTSIVSTLKFLSLGCRGCSSDSWFERSRLLRQCILCLTLERWCFRRFTSLGEYRARIVLCIHIAFECKLSSEWLEFPCGISLLYSRQTPRNLRQHFSSLVVCSWSWICDVESSSLARMLEAPRWQDWLEVE